MAFQLFRIIINSDFYPVDNLKNMDRIYLQLIIIWNTNVLALMEAVSHAF
jgi:hypothetical protein